MSDVAVKQENVRAFRIWSAALIALYVAVCFAGWSRTLLPDEIRPLILAQESPRALLQLARDDIVQTPGSYLVAQAWLNIFGHTDAAAKALAAAVGAATLLLFALLARRITPHWRMASLLWCLIYLRVGSSPNLVRMYGLLVLCVVAALLVWDHWRRNPRHTSLIAWALLMSAAIYMHPSAVLTVGATTVAVWLLGPRKLAFTTAALVPVLSLLLWVAIVYPVYRTRGLDANVEALADDPTREMARLPFYFLTGDPPGASSPLEDRYVLGTPSWMRWAAILLGLGLAGLAAPAILRRVRDREADRSPRDDWLLANFLLVTLPVLALYAVSLLTQPVLGARYLYCTLPALVLLIVELAGLGGLAGRAVLTAMMLWVALSAAYALRINRRPVPAHSAVAYLDQNLEPADLILIGHHSGLGWQFFWEWTRARHRTEPVHILPTVQPEWLRRIVPAETFDSIDFTAARRVWLVNRRPNVRAEVETRLPPLGFVLADSTVQDMHFLSLYSRTEPGGRPGAAAGATVPPR
jgi:hypothetical protein